MWVSALRLDQDDQLGFLALSLFERHLWPSDTEKLNEMELKISVETRLDLALGAVDNVDLMFPFESLNIGWPLLFTLQGVGISIPSKLDRL